MKEMSVLAVDDEPHILNALTRLLRKENYNFFTAPSGKEGLLFLAEHPVHLIISDQRMPEMTGTEFLQEVKKKYPKTIRVILSGYAEVDTIIQSINKGEIYRFIPKPWNDEELKLVIRQCLEHYQLLEKTRLLAKEIQVHNEELEYLNRNMESILDERTKSLKFYQAMLSELPLPVAGISSEQILVLLNEAFWALPFTSGSVFIGGEVSEVFPKALAEQIKKCFQDSFFSGSFPFTLEGKPWIIHPELIREEGHIIGCLLVFEEGGKK
jgi:CheY-like chemotaxis protein